jgi:predicted site-specific integrase-resolvase
MAHNQVDPLTVSYRDAAAMLSISIKTLRTMVYSGELPTVLINKRSKIAVNDIKVYIEQQRTRRTSPGSAA